MYIPRQVLGSNIHKTATSVMAIAEAFIWLHFHAPPLDVVVAHAVCRSSEAILEALGGLYMQDCRYELRRIPLLRTGVNSRAGSSTDSYATTCPTSGRIE